MKTKSNGVSAQVIKALEDLNADGATSKEMAVLTELPYIQVIKALSYAYTRNYVTRQSIEKGPGKERLWWRYYSKAGYRLKRMADKAMALAEHEKTLAQPEERDAAVRAARIATLVKARQVKAAKRAALLRVTSKDRSAPIVKASAKAKEALPPLPVIHGNKTLTIDTPYAIITITPKGD